MTVDSKMTAIANEIRNLSGSTGKLGLDSMASNLGDANNEVDTQADLISQISSALENKASVSPTLQNKTVTPTTETQTVTADSGYDGLQRVTVEGDSNLVAENIKNGISIFGVNGSYEGSGGSGGSIETCTVNVATNVMNPVIYSTINNNGIITTYTTDNTEHTLTVVCGSYIFVPINSTIPAYNISGGVRHITTLSGYATHRTFVFEITALAGNNVTINCYDDD